MTQSASGISNTSQGYGVRIANGSMDVDARTINKVYGIFVDSLKAAEWNERGLEDASKALKFSLTGGDGLALPENKAECTARINSVYSYLETLYKKDNPNAWQDATKALARSREALSNNTSQGYAPRIASGSIDINARTINKVYGIFVDSLKAAGWNEKGLETGGGIFKFSLTGGDGLALPENKAECTARINSAYFALKAQYQDNHNALQDITKAIPHSVDTLRKIAASHGY